MDVAKKKVLQKCRENIVANLEAKDLIDDLFSRLVIDSDDRDKILSQVCVNFTLIVVYNYIILCYFIFQGERTFRTRCLLDILVQKGNEEYDNFLDILSQEYDWLANSIRRDIGCVSEIEYEEQIYSEALASGDVPQLPMHYVPRTSEVKYTFIIYLRPIQCA